MISFKGYCYPKSVILQCVRWYVAYCLSYRDIEEMMKERGIDVDHSTLNRWVLKFSPLLEKEFQKSKRCPGGRVRLDETYLLVKGPWKYLYRAVDKEGNTIDFLLTAKRDKKAAKRFLKKMINRNGKPSLINIDIICANTSQAKGRVERANQTLQDRLVKELRLQGISSMREANAFLPTFIEAFNQRFAKPAYNDKDIHRELNDGFDLDDVFSWREESTVSNALTIQYDRVIYLLEPNDVTRDLRRKKVTIYDYPDGTISIKHQGLPLPYSIFDKVSQIDQGAIVSNKRLGAVLNYAQEEQVEKGLKRSKKAPKRRAQQELSKERTRQPNPAVG